MKLLFISLYFNKILQLQASALMKLLFISLYFNEIALYKPLLQ